MDLIQVLILSLVEGLTEFLPISSTGHLVLTSYLLNIPQTEFIKSFEVIIQLGAILAVVVLYWKRLISDFQAWKRIIIAFIPTAIVGFTLYQIIKEYLIGNALITVLALFLGGIALILIELLLKNRDQRYKNLSDLNYKQAFLIGLFQSISIVPGVSRAAATIFGGLFTGLDRKSAVEFSFLLAVPTMLAATSLDLIKSNFTFSSTELISLSLGLVCSFLVALIAIKFLIRYVQDNNFILFGIYRIILSLVFYLVYLR